MMHMIAKKLEKQTPNLRKLLTADLEIGEGNLSYL